MFYFSQNISHINNDNHTPPRTISVQNYMYMHKYVSGCH